MNDAIRNQFPSLKREVNGRPIVHFDGPAGTQVPQSVIDAMVNVYSYSNANSHGHFVTAHETDQLLHHCRTQVAALLGAEGPETISFGANMTSLNFSLANAIAKTLQPGDEILITQLDHEANRGPWLNLRRHGIIVREVSLEEDGNLDYADMEKKINERTRVVAIGLASNIFGTVNEIDRVRILAYEVGALLVVDAVHYVPHLMSDVRAIDCDFMLCSAYKFYGPHIGILYSRPGALDRLNPDRLRVQKQQAPNRIETGTQNHAALAGVSASIDFLASFGSGNSTREKIITAMSTIQTHERGLAQQLYLGLRDLEGVDIYGPPLKEEQRAPTISFTIENKRPEDVCKFLAEHSICAWDGHFYAKRAIEVMDLVKEGGVTRMGIAVYNSAEEVEYAISTLRKLVGN
jgi:cysteine desulfurase family protein (TIGR01976 family)